MTPPYNQEELMPHPGILENFQKMEHLPTLPGVALKILEAVRSEETSLNEIADILSKDPPLTAKILGLINSAFYSLPTQVTSISHAVKLLGINTVKKVALSFSLVRSFSQWKQRGFRLPGLLEKLADQRRLLPSDRRKNPAGLGGRRLYPGVAAGYRHPGL